MNCNHLATIAVVLVVISWHATGVQVARNRTANVDTRIGSGGFGFGIGEINPGPSFPFGCLRLGPDTSIGLEPIRIPFQTYAGYAYDSNFVECFSHTHVVGAGLGDYQNFGVTVTRSLDNNTVTNAGYKSLYSHDQEVALPGYYAVELLSYNTYAELTVSGTHSSLHRYTCRSSWPDGNAQLPCVLLLDVCHGFPRSFTDDVSQCKEAQIYNITTQDGVTFHVDAYVLMAGDFSREAPLGGIQIYLHAEISAWNVTNGGGMGTQVILTPRTWVAGSVGEDTIFTELTTSGSLGAAFTASNVEPGTDVQFLFRSGISFVSPYHAMMNLRTQQHLNGDWLTFEESVQVAVNAWEDILSAVSYSGGVGEDTWHRTVFDSTLYRAHLAPTTYSEYDGAYLGLDQQVHYVAPSPSTAVHLSDLSIWDIYRTQAPMLLWTKPDVAQSLGQSMLDDYLVTGSLPKWVFASVDTGSMVGLHSAVIFEDYTAKNLKGLNASQILEIIAAGVAGQNAQMSQYGYVPANNDGDSASDTQDFSIDAAAVVTLASALGNQSAVAAFVPYANSYRNVWDNQSNFFCPRFANGSFWCPDPLLTYPFEHSYVEGDAWQYRWYVPQDPTGLIGLFPNATYFVDELYQFFALEYVWPLNNTMPNPYFWAGNEPDIQTQVLFNWAGNEYAYLTSEIFPQILDTYYIPYASGLPGDDDYGAMSAWCFWGYIGLFPMPPTLQYALFAPRFDVINVTLNAPELAVSPWRSVPPSTTSPRTTVVQIVCTGRPLNGTAYVASASINGVPLTSAVIDHAQLFSGNAAMGTRIDIVLTDEPTVFGQLPPSRGGTPVYEPRGRTADGSLRRASNHVGASRAANRPDDDVKDDEAIRRALLLHRERKLNGNRRSHQ